MSQYWIFAQRLSLIAVTNVLVSLTGLILLPILTKSIPVNDYGIWVQVSITAELVPVAVTMGLPYSLARFLPIASGDKKLIRDKFYSMLFFVILSASVISFLLYSFSERIAELLFDGQIMVVKLTSLIVFVECLNAMFFNLLRASQQIKKYSLLTIVKSYLSIAIVSFFIFNHYGILGATFGLLIAYAILALIFLFIIISSFGFAVPTFSGLKDYLSFGIPVVPWNLSNWIINSSDRYIISIFLGTAFVGYYSPGYTLGNIIIMFIAPFTLMLPVALSKSYDEGNIQEVKEILSHSLKFFSAIAIPSFFGLTLLSKPILQAISTPEIASEGYLITPFVALGGIMYGYYTIIAQILILKKAMKLTALIWAIIAVENLMLTILIVPKLGIIGAAITTTVAMGTAFIVIYYLALKKISFNIDKMFILKCVASSLLMSVTMLLWIPASIKEILVLIFACILIYIIVLFTLGGVTKEELNFFRSMLNHES